MGTIHVTFGAFKDVKAQVMANRGERCRFVLCYIGMIFQCLFFFVISTRCFCSSCFSGVSLIAERTKKPLHAFNYLRQFRILSKARCGNLEQQMKDSLAGE